jgi:hypothetical protein
MLAAAVAPTSVEGRRRTPDYEGEVRLQRCGGDVCGRLVTSTLIAANPDLRDMKNADPSLRGRPLKGLDFVTGLKGGPGVWTDGTVYNPDDGRGGGACDPRRRPRATQRLRRLPALQHRDLESYPLIKRLITRSD